MDDNELTASTDLVPTKQEAITKRKPRKNKTEALNVQQPNILDRLNDLSVDETFNLLTMALRKDDAERTEIDQAIINGVDSFKRDLAQRVVEESKRRDALQTQTVETIAHEQRAVVAEIESIFRDSYASHNRMIESVNAVPDDVAELITTSLGSSDPND